MTYSPLESVVFHAISLGQPLAIDSSAFIAYLGDETPRSSLVASVIDSDLLDIVISSIVLSEVLVSAFAELGQSGLERTRKSIERIPSVTIVGFGQQQAIETARVRVETRLKFPDAAIIATARVAGAIAIVGNDRAWQNKSLGIQYIHLDDVVREQEEEATR